MIQQFSKVLHWELLGDRQMNYFTLQMKTKQFYLTAKLFYTVSYQKTKLLL